MKKFRKLLALVLAVAMVTSVAFASPNHTVNDSNPLNISASYTMDGADVIETTTFTDFDGVAVLVVRKISPDNISRAKIIKADVTTLVEGPGDYEMFRKMTNQPKFIGPMPKNSDLTGSQYKHVLYPGSEQTATFTKTHQEAMVLGGITGAASFIIGAISMPMGAAATLAAWIITTGYDSNPDKIRITTTTYEVRFSYDDAYYCHCYHSVCQTYDSGGHADLNYKDYYQVIGG